jgi:hypothetical protein
MPITQVLQCQILFSDQLGTSALQHMIKIHNADEGASSLLKISLSEKEKQKKKHLKTTPSLACLRRQMK